jgi:hypothetical protein
VEDAGKGVNIFVLELRMVFLATEVVGNRGAEENTWTEEG